MIRAQSILKEVFGFETFWPLQEKAIAHILFLEIIEEHCRTHRISETEKPIRNP